MLNGLFLGIGFLVPTLWILGIGGGAYFLYLLLQEVPFRQKIFGAWTAWTIKAFLATNCFSTVYPIEWLPLDIGTLQVPLIFFTWFILAVCLGSGAVLFVVTVELLRKKVKLHFWASVVLVYPITWIVCESLGSLAFSVFFYGPGGTFTTAYSMGYVGYVLAEHDVLLQFARLAGVFSLSFLFVCMTGLVLWSSQQNKNIQNNMIACVIVLYLTSFVSVAQDHIPSVSDQYQVVAVDTQLGSKLQKTQEGERQARRVIEEAVESALAQDPDYVILPEDSRYFDQTKPASSIKQLFQLQHDSPRAVLIDSGTVTYNGATVLQAFVYNGLENSTERFHKRYLVPQGEFIPIVYTQLFQLLGYAESTRYLTQNISYRIGPWTDQRKAAINTPGVLFCFESVDPRAVKNLVSERPHMPFVAHLVSHAWFHDPYELWHQLDVMLKVQAVWSGQYIVSAGNMMSGKVYTPNGASIEMKTVAKGDLWVVKEVSIPRVYTSS